MLYASAEDSIKNIRQQRADDVCNRPCTSLRGPARGRGNPFSPAGIQVLACVLRPLICTLCVFARHCEPVRTLVWQSGFRVVFAGHELRYSTFLRSPEEKLQKKRRKGGEDSVFFPS